MFDLTIESQFSAAHQLRGYKGKCEALHGHNWRVQVTISSEKLDELGMVLDFHDLKAITGEVLASLDHAFLNDVFPFTEINPSSENMAKWIYESIRKKILKKNCEISSVTVWENETSSATYYE
ncbi:MAG: 6-carboxytetrahydropterin synthase QueD [Nitrospiraceae bacterium]|nr:MAG: 6-carboxytetrahydropterin synthase QueD [Nitrospiraceae bacterium]